MNKTLEKRFDEAFPSKQVFPLMNVDRSHSHDMGVNVIMATRESLIMFIEKEIDKQLEENDY